MSKATLQNTAVDADVEFKAINGAISVDEAKGIVECFVAGIGNKDSVGDIIIPGAFEQSLKRRKPRVVWGHDWNQPIGKVLEIYEVGPSDPRLPAKMKAAKIGGLFARVQFNLKSERGREAFANIMFFGEEQEWSIGYKTLDAVYDSSQQANILKLVELYEVSPVLHGANQLTATISIKSDQSGDRLDSMRKSKWDLFDRRFAQMIKQDHPDIWDAGGNIKGDDQYEILSKILEQGGMAKTEDQIKAIELREAWIARHKGDFRLPGVIAQIKWLAVGTRGEDYMKNIVRDAIEKKMDSKCWDGGESGPSRVPLVGEGDESMPVAPRMVAMAISSKLGGAVRLRELSKNIVVFDLMKDDDMQTWRMGYHFDGTQIMFGEPERVKPTTVFLPMENEDEEEEEYDEDGMKPQQVKTGPCWPGYEMVGMKPGKNGGMVPNCVPVKGESGVKAPIPPDAIPQERFTGDVLRGRGPRRGNLERLLRYWRPIMRREGGFRRCRVILADHPELYPLNNICAWLHHETTGLWPNEGCHHPGMKNCRRKLRNVMRGSIISDSDFESRLRQLGDGKSMMHDEMYGDVTDDDIMNANKVLRQFMAEEKEFMEYLADEKNWMHVGDDDSSMEMEHMWMKPEKAEGCGCGCGGKDAFDDDFDYKAGRSISNVNTGKIQQAINLLQQVVVGSSPDPVEMKKKSDEVTLDDFIDPVADYYGMSIIRGQKGLKIGNIDSVSQEGIDAFNNAVAAYRASFN